MISSNSLRVLLVSALAAPCGDDGDSRTSAAKPQPPAAHILLDRAAQTFGGRQRLAALDGLIAHGVGVEHRSAEVQGWSPESVSTARHEMWVAIRPRHQRAMYEHRTGRHDGTERWRRRASSGDTSYFVDFMSGSATRSVSSTAQSEASRMTRILPHVVLRDVLADSAATVLGDTTIAGARFWVVGASLSGTPVRLLLNEMSNRLTSVSFDLGFPGIGSTTTEYRFIRYQAHSDLGLTPITSEIRVGGTLLRAVTYDRYEVNEIAADSMLAIPERFAGNFWQRGSIVALTRDAFMLPLIGGSYNVLAVDTDSGLVVIEAPARYPLPEEFPQIAGAFDSADGYGEEVLQTLSRFFPGRNVRFVVPTHFHGDHSGGVMPFVRRGATILAAHSDRRFYNRLLAGNGMSADSRLRTFGGALHLRTKSGDTLSFLPFGRNIHTEQNLVVWLSRARVLYQGDLFYFSGDATFPPRSERIMLDFVRWLDARKLAPRRVYGFHVRGYAEPRHLEEIRRNYRPR